MPRVLFVSPDGDLRAAAARVIAAAGWSVTTAAHAGHASLACADGRTFDVLVTDDPMPEATARVLAARLRRYCPGLQLVRLCDRSAAAGEGIAVVRPFTADHLTDAIIQAASTIPAA